MDPLLERKLAALRLPELTLWAPGPHALSPAVVDVLTGYETTYSHRSSDFKECYHTAIGLLRECFHIPDGFTPLVFGHTGSYNWEMVAANTPDTYRTLGVEIGAFSQRWVQLFRDRGRKIDVLRADWGKGVSPQEWRRGLQQGYDLGIIIHNETSTGVALPVEDLCEALRDVSPDTLVGIDAVSIAGAVDVRIDTVRPDYYLWSLQKDFATPAIGSVMVVSDRAVEVARSTPNRGYVLDLVEWTERAGGDQTPMTVPDLTLRCLIARLREMLAEGDARFERHRALSQMQRDWAREHGLSLLAQPGFESPTVTAVCLPDGVSGPDFVAAARKRLNVQLAAGYGPTRDTTLRIAAMGCTSTALMAQVLDGLSLILGHWDDIA